MCDAQFTSDFLWYSVAALSSFRGDGFCLRVRVRELELWQLGCRVTLVVNESEYQQDAHLATMKTSQIGQSRDNS